MKLSINELEKLLDLLDCYADSIPHGGPTWTHAQRIMNNVKKDLKKAIIRAAHA